MKLFLDANVIISVLNKEYPIFSFSSRILSLSDVRGFDLYTSPICLAIAFYFSTKKSGETIAKRKIDTLSNHVKLCSVSGETVRQALDDNKVHDFEDGLQYYSALQAGCQVIITEGKQDFYFSKIEVLGCEEFISAYF